MAFVGSADAHVQDCAQDCARHSAQDCVYVSQVIADDVARFPSVGINIVNQLRLPDPVQEKDELSRCALAASP